MNQYEKSTENRFELRAILVGVRHVKLVLFTIVLTTALAVVIAFLLPPTYRAQTVLVPTINDSRNTSASGLSTSGIGALASRFGLGGVAGSVDASQEVIATLQSRSFLEAFIAAHDLLPILFADRWDSVGKKWVVDKEDVPERSDAVKKILEDVLEVRADAQTGLITIKIDWKDPNLAAMWANDLVKRINFLMRTKAIEEAEGSLKYLRVELEKTQPIEIRQSLYGLIETNLNRISLANGRTEYAFRVIDPAVAPKMDDFVSPKRAVIILVGVVFGLFLGIILSIFSSAVLPLRFAVGKG